MSDRQRRPMTRMNAVALALAIAGSVLTILNDWVLHLAPWVSLIGTIVLLVGVVIIYRSTRQKPAAGKHTTP